MNSARSWLVWSVAMVAYVIAVLQRSSLGVASVAAADRFEVSASLLSSLAVVQIIVYAALQIPVGVILDRVGPKAMITIGAVLMAAGQLVLALAPTIEIAIIGRVLVGAGDAMTFISVIRLLASWFSGRILPQVSQWTGNIGSLGQVLSAIPLSLLLQGSGWQATFLTAAALSALAGILVAVLLSDGPGRRGRVKDAPIAWRVVARQLRESLARPGTQLGFWSHFVSQSSGTVFALLWGFPIMVNGLGYSQAEASGMLTVLVGAGLVSGPILGILSARYPMRRSNVILGIMVAIGAAWALVLLWPGEPPFWAVTVLVVILGVGGPGSMIGFDYARTFNPMRSLGSANGIVNVGGFLATFAMMFLIGVLLDLQNAVRMSQGLPEALYAWDSFRLALTVQFPILGLGIVFLLLARARTRRGLHEDEGIQVAPLWVALVRGFKRGKR